MDASAGSAGFDGLLARLSDQHERFLAEVASKAFAALRAENARLCEENERLRGALDSQVQESEPEPPVLPPLRTLGNKEKLVDAVWEPPHLPHHEVSTQQLPQLYQSTNSGADTLPGVVIHPSEGEFMSERRSADKRGSFASRRMTMQLDDVDRIHHGKEKRRLRNVFRLRSVDSCITQDALFSLLSLRAPTSSIIVGNVITELKGIYATMKPDEAWREEQVPANAISVDALADMLLAQNLLDFVSSDAREDVIHVTGALQLQTVDDVVDEATRISNTNQAARFKADINWEWPLNVVVSITVIVNLLAMGISLDFDDPDNVGWLVLEALCVAVFISEAALKMWFWRCKYFRGEAAYWNMADLIITVISVFELTVTVVSLQSEADSLAGGQVASASRVAVMARALRCARVVRLMKLLHSPVLRDLANMLVGFVIGLPSLFWTLVLFLLILYMLGIVFRQAFGPYPGQNLTATCGFADDLPDVYDEVCKVHYIYGEEFFGTVGTAMFTSFRFMLGDYSSRGGKSLVVAFSAGYGKRFDFVFVSWMVVVIFGLFNIITAIFVDSTISGLKHNDVKRKYARQYERSYVQTKLKELVGRMQFLHESRRGLLDNNRLSGGSSRVGAIAASKIELDEGEFVEVMGDEVVSGLLGDLDVEMLHPEAMFDTFDPDGNGVVTLYEMVQAILKLRGEPQKGDMIATWVSLKSLHEKVDTFSVALKEVQAKDKELKVSTDRVFTAFDSEMDISPQESLV